MTFLADILLYTYIHFKKATRGDSTYVCYVILMRGVDVLDYLYMYTKFEGRLSTLCVGLMLVFMTNTDATRTFCFVNGLTM